MPGKIKLLLMCAGLASNGIDVFVLNVLRNIDKSKYDITLMIAIDKGVKSLNEDEVRALGVNLVNICDLDTLKKKVTYFKTVYRLMRQGNFDVVHANMDLLNGIILSLAKRAGIKKRIAHAHNSRSQVETDGVKGKVKFAAQKIFLAVMRTLIKRNATVLLGCSDLANEYFFTSHASKAIVINNGIDLSKFSFKGANEFREEFEKKRVNLVTVGRLSAQKNPFMLVDIIIELSQLRNDFIFHWFGSGEFNEEINKKVYDSGKEEYFKFWGVQKNINEFLPYCDYFLLPSLFEGLPVSLVEAQAAGLSCFVSDKVSRQCDAGGCRFLPIDSAAFWADEIDNCIKNNDRFTADKESLKRFDISYTIKQLERVYEGRESDEF